MIKIIENSEEALKVAKKISKLEGIQGNFLVGLTGSYAEGTQKKSSGMDFLLKAEDDNVESGSLELTKEIGLFMAEHYRNKYNILWYDLIEKDEEEKIKESPKLGVGKNPHSPFITMVSKVKWVEDYYGDGEVETEKTEEVTEETEDLEGIDEDIIELLGEDEIEESFEITEV